MFDLPTIWALLICIALLAYVVLDGFDLGVGILFPLGRNTEERNRMMNTVISVWDGNETWLVLGGWRFVRRLSPGLLRFAYGVLRTGDCDVAGPGAAGCCV